MLDEASSNGIAVGVEHDTHQGFVILDALGLGAVVSNFAEASVAFVVAEAESTVGAAHVIGERNEIFSDSSGFMDVVAHDAVAVENKVFFFAGFKVVVFDGV